MVSPFAPPQPGYFVSKHKPKKKKKKGAQERRTKMGFLDEQDVRGNLGLGAGRYIPRAKDA